MLFHRKNGLSTFQNDYILKMSGKMTKNFLYTDSHRNIRNAIQDFPLTSEEIVKNTTLLKSKKASDHNSIRHKMIKLNLPSSSSFLVILFNKILKPQIYLKKWSMGIITPIPKSGEMENPDNFHGVTFNSCLSKLFKLMKKTN